MYFRKKEDSWSEMITKSYKKHKKYKLYVRWKYKLEILQLSWRNKDL